jgi:hypothetical protein
MSHGCARIECEEDYEDYPDVKQNIRKQEIRDSRRAKKIPSRDYQVQFDHCCDTHHVSMRNGGRKPKKDWSR